MGSRTIVVGDIHGCYDELMALMEKVELQANDRVVSVGDLISKGPKSREVLELFISDKRFTSVIGNHDLTLRRRWNGEARSALNLQAIDSLSLFPPRDGWSGEHRSRRSI